jgi:hypothetical protein
MAGDAAEGPIDHLCRLDLPAAVQGPAGPPSEARIVAAYVCGSELVLGIQAPHLQPGEAIRVVFLIPRCHEELSSTGEVTTARDGLAVVWLRSVPARTLGLLAAYLASVACDSEP